MTVLDWRDPSHYARGRPKPCRICGKPTNLRDEVMRPCHKSCAETEIDKETD